MGIATGILTLPGYGPSDTVTGTLTVDLLNSVGAPKVSFTVDPGITTNQMSATAVSFFNPLPGAYSQNMPALNQQFFNTGRKVIAGMNYLYDAGGGYLGNGITVNGQTSTGNVMYANTSPFSAPSTVTK
jgi:hypothetical protein